MRYVDIKSKISYKHIAVDPYNNFSYEHYDNEGSVVAGYTEEMKQKTVSYTCIKITLSLTFYHMTDEYYFKTMGEGHQLVYESRIATFWFVSSCAFRRTTHD